MCESSYLHQAYAFKTCRGVDKCWVHLRLVQRARKCNQWLLFRKLGSGERNSKFCELLSYSAVILNSQSRFNNYFSCCDLWRQVGFTKTPLLILHLLRLTYLGSPFCIYSSQSPPLLMSLTGSLSFIISFLLPASAFHTSTMLPGSSLHSPPPPFIQN